MNDQPHKLTTNIFRLVAFVQILIVLMPLLSLNLFLILLFRVWALYAVIILLLSLTLVVLARKLKEEGKKVILISRGVCAFYLIIGYLPMFRLVEAFRVEGLPQEALLALGSAIGIGAFIVSILFIPCLVDLRKKNPTSRTYQPLSRSALQGR
jgi:hypothetical protein